MAKKINSGDVFSIKVDESHFITGRVLLNIDEQCIKPNKIDIKSPLMSAKGGVLIEIFNTINKTDNISGLEILIPGIFMYTKSLKDENVSLIGNQFVDPEKIDFPEVLFSYERDNFFKKGEIMKKVDINSDEYYEIDVLFSVFSIYYITGISLYYLKQKKLFEDQDVIENMHLKNRDLRFSSHKEKIYKMIGWNDNKNYYQESLKMGHDIKRFF